MRLISWLWVNFSLSRQILLYVEFQWGYTYNITMFNIVPFLAVYYFSHPNLTSKYSSCKILTQKFISPGKYSSQQVAHHSTLSERYILDLSSLTCASLLYISQIDGARSLKNIVFGRMQWIEKRKLAWGSSGTPHGDPAPLASIWQED